MLDFLEGGVTRFGGAEGTVGNVLLVLPWSLFVVLEF